MKHKVNVDRAIICTAAAVLIFAIWGPETIAGYSDKRLLNQITVETIENESEGYRYSMNSNEKLYLLSKCLNNRIVPESDFSAMTRVDDINIDFERLSGNYAFVQNYQEPSDKELTESEIYEVCNREMARLYELGVIPEIPREVTAAAYTAVLYSAIDVLEPRNNVVVWKVSLSTDIQNADKANRLIDAYIDADTGKVYEFYVRTEGKWDEMQPAAMVQAWSDYIGLYNLEVSENVNPLTESTQNVQKYTVPGGDGEDTIVTLGFYEGINELFLKIEK